MSYSYGNYGMGNMGSAQQMSSSGGNKFRYYRSIYGFDSDTFKQKPYPLGLDVSYIPVRKEYANPNFFQRFIRKLIGEA